MKVAMYYNNKDVRIEEMPKPKISSDELLVKAMACGICGSDVMEWYRIKKAPIVLGHEMTGEIVEIGKNVKKFKVGDRVFVSHHVPCNECHYCFNDHHTACETLHKTNFYPGGFSEYIRIPKLNVETGVYLLPKEVSYEDGTFIEPLACVLRGQRLAKIGKNQTVLVLGSGISGLLHIQMSKLNNAAKIIATDINDYRIKMAKKFGADFVINANEDVPNKVKELNENRLTDRVIVCAGSLSAANQALKYVDKGGTILFFAVPEPGKDLTIPINDFWRNEITIMTSYGAAPRDLKESLEIIRQKKINVHDMITHKLSLAEIGKGFQIVADAKESMKVIIEPYR